MKAVTLTATIREELGKKVKKLRAAGFTPATVYGDGVKSVSLSVPTKEFLVVFKQTGETGLIDLKFGSQSQHTLISDVSIQPLTREPLHVQFHAVKLTEKLKAKVPLALIGESPVVASNTGILLLTLNEVEVEALPTDLPEQIEIDAAQFTAVDQQITVADLKAPTGVEILTGPEELVVKVASAVSEEAKKEAEEAAAKAAAAEAQAPAAENASPEASAPATEEKAS